MYVTILATKTVHNRLVIPPFTSALCGSWPLLGISRILEGMKLGKAPKLRHFNLIFNYQAFFQVLGLII